MSSLATIVRTGVVAVAVASVLAACGDSGDSASGESTASATSVVASSNSAPVTPASVEPASAPKTIQEYISANKIAELVIRRGDPGPVVDLPVPDGWKVQNDLDAAPYGAIVYTKTEVPSNPPRILALMSKLTGDVDRDKLLELAPGELHQLDGWSGPADGTRGTLGGFDSVQIAGTYVKDGSNGVIGQKTVIIPGKDGSTYVLQLNAYADASEQGILGAATEQVDKKTKITV
ncbi:LpqN/LpqT family lipoprotein [Gordonia sp. (in: high G+C Gram-positive bacteria)]|uniref:LpqN/LpqT family lipoprotein n=1 Tax=Gordonia sp. (in: high G+C Gram-positive bacteria) TaxID=84139 RepID=UPI002616516F|nr:LpqN/LpqT family lipoprotein [Gordonia sp. (in: high G+C Gram-positive bacteria)]HMS75515.1 LpqN/LpqT family lipoprotein [Gordonia sp. (in: high G+C Gram-positive bacteria)]